MTGRVWAIGGAVAAVIAGGIVSLTVTMASGSTSSSPTSVTKPAVDASPSTPTWDVAPDTTPTSSSPTTSPTSTAPTSTAPPASGTITYVVRPGDNLSIISAWFHLHGYGALYDANRAVIGSNPDLIFPGERITISGGRLTMSSR